MSARGLARKPKVPPHPLFELLIGALLGQLVFWIGMGLPLAVTDGISLGLKMSESASWSLIAAAVVIGAGICGATGFALASTRQLTWLFLVGAEAVPVIWLLRLAAMWSSVGRVDLMVAGSYLLGGLGLAIGYGLGYFKRAPSPANDASSSLQ